MNKTELSIRIDFPNGRFGPGKAALLAAIEETGSISGAARRLGVSYRKAWRLIDELNQTFKEQVVETQTGGAEKGGAQLTQTGQLALRTYQQIIAQAHKAAQRELKQIAPLIADIADRAD